MRVRSWFSFAGLCLAAIVAVLAAAPPDLRAGIVPSHAPGPASSRNEDLERIRQTLERNVVRQKLQDYGVSQRDAMDKVRELDDRELHLLATRMERIPDGESMAGVDSGAAVLLVLVVVAVVLVLTLFVLGAKAVVTDILNKPTPEPVYQDQ
jgi:hypothetical protein